VLSLTCRSARSPADAILSPDGTRLVYVSHNRLLTRRLDQPQATELPGRKAPTRLSFRPTAGRRGAGLWTRWVGELPTWIHGKARYVADSDSAGGMHERMRLVSEYATLLPRGTSPA